MIRQSIGRPARRFWHSSTGVGSVSTAGYLRRQLVWLLALTAVAVSALFSAYHEVHRDTAAISDRTGPAIVELARAHTLLRLAHTTAAEHLAYLTQHPEQPDILSFGEEYASLLTEARQSLDLADRTNALNRGDRQSLRIVSGLVDGYAKRIDGAWKQYDKPKLSRANLSYATTMMHAKSSGVLNRIADLQSKQSAALDRQQEWGTAPLLTWPVAVASCLLLGVRLVGIQFFLRRRFRLRLSIPLAAVTLLLAALPVLAYGTWEAHGCQADVRGVAARLEPAGRPVAQGTIDEVESDMSEALSGGNAGGWARVTLFVPLAGVLMAGVVLWTLRSHLAEYTYPRKPGGGRR
ncbi:hypothetical protein [Streptomyces sp. H27-C3]|uniref:hypothetical protein n=1 Tax=Streptomyces sp. H27-C3 TaxID=3046305 RepID=UPI0024BB19DD|nr:hypothetical protein [Streptomyces sp. H27-C3]MDJ0460669.1 hypothetical protein [Streptomyces sp. H27-C3]